MYVDRERTSLGQGEYKLLGLKIYPLTAHVGSNLIHNINSWFLTGEHKLLAYLVIKSMQVSLSLLSLFPHLTNHHPSTCFLITFTTAPRTKLSSSSREDWYLEILMYRAPSAMEYNNDGRKSHDIQYIIVVVILCTCIIEASPFHIVMIISYRQSPGR